MSAPVRLSEASKRVAEALAVFDGVALEILAEQMERAAEGGLAIEREPMEKVRARQIVLAELLAATAKNLRVLHQVRERKVFNSWEL